MAKRKELTVADVAGLGTERLASLLFEAAENDSTLMRTLRVAVTSGTDASRAVRELESQIKGLRRGKAFIDWQKVPNVVRDLQALSAAIAGPMAEADPPAALELMFAFIDLAPGLIERSDDSSGRIGDEFRAACEASAAIAARAAPGFPAVRGAQRAYRTYLVDGYGVAENIIAAFAKTLDTDTRAAMRSWIEADLAQLQPVAPNDPSAAGRLSEWRLLGALGDIADAAGDVDAYCEAQQRFGPRVRDDAGMVRRLLDVGRAEEALAVLDAALPNPAKNLMELADLRVAALDSLGRGDEAQAVRWTEFTRSLRPEPLRELLKRLPDFDDFDKEQEALDLAVANSDPHRALDFLVNWPDLRRAGALVRARHGVLDGNHYSLLAPAADVLSAAEPLAATLLFRCMIDFTLTRGRSTRYGHAADHLASCAWLAKTIKDWEGHAPHHAYLDGLKQRHPRKSGFWSRVKVR
jgi:hypothetical protein